MEAVKMEIIQNSSTIIAAEKSTHFVEVFVLPSLIKHANADSLSIVKIADTDYTYVARTEDWADKIGKLVAWIPPDSIVDVKRSEFAFLGEKGSRVRAKKLRGITSYGILVVLPDNCGLKPGDNAAQFLGVEHYDPEEAITVSKNIKGFSLPSGEVASPPQGIVYPKYDIDSYLKFARRVFKDQEEVYVTEKIHGCNAKFVYRDNTMYCGSRNEWKKEFNTAPKITLEELMKKIPDPQKAQEVYQKAVVNFKPKKSMWWTVLDSLPALRKFCEEHPSWCVYGEIFGNVKNFKYGAADNQLLFRAFDILVADGPIPRWLDADEFIATCDKFEIPHVPLLAMMPFDFEKLIAMAEGNTTFANANHIREGCVVKPKVDRWDPMLGRVALKIVSSSFLEIN